MTKCPAEVIPIDQKFSSDDVICTPIAFGERVTFWLQRAWSLPCMCAFAALYVYALCNGYTRAHAQII